MYAKNSHLMYQLPSFLVGFVYLAVGWIELEDGTH